MNSSKRLGMILKGYPRISESFISTEILLLESCGLPIEIYSLRQPRENFSHDHVKRIKAPVTYMPEYVLPNWKQLTKSNVRLWSRLGARYTECFIAAVIRGLSRRKPATLRHFLQAGHLSFLRLSGSPVTHIHAHFCHTPTSVAFFASELTGIPYSFTAHAKDIYTTEPDQLIRKISMARFVVTCTKYNAAYLSMLAEQEGCTTPIHTIYHGIDLDLFSYGSSPGPAPPYRILSVGRLVPKKGYADLLKALRILDNSRVDFQFTHIGSGEMESEVRSMIAGYGLSHRVALLGTLPHKEVVEYYRKSHCLALACKVAENGDRDGIPNVLVEAMAVGLPVITSDVSAIPELVEHGVTGTLTPPGNPFAMAEAIQGVLTRRLTYDTQVRNAREKVESNFDNRICVQKLYQLFKEVLDAS